MSAPFTVAELLGVGGFGAVYRGLWHGTAEPSPVAVKLLSLHPDDPMAERKVQQEVRAVARMSHPNITRVHDYGLLEDALSIGERRFQPGTPFLVMELAPGGNLARWRHGMDGEGFRGLLNTLLRALAHAHARGIIHRDIKPANVLSGSPAGGLWRLADFGIAHAIHGDAEGLQDVAGTPTYMAPEQIRGALREHGPWTDLYALGCMAFELACGRPPYTGEQVAVLHGHLSGMGPTLQGVEPAFGVWLSRMMATEPSSRFRWAADALHALADVPTLPSLGDAHASASAAASTCFFTDTIGSLPPGDTLEVLEAQREPVDTPPPVPERWEQPLSWTTPPTGAGLEVVRLREAGVVGRLAEQAALWEALRDVQQTGRPRVIVLRGPEGLGKRHLARWLSEQAHMLAAATTLVARPAVGGGDALAGMVATCLSAAGLKGQALRAHLRGVLAAADRDTRRALTGYLDRSDEGIKAPMLPFFRLLTRGGRLSVLCVEEAQHDTELARLAQQLLQTPESLPVLLILTQPDGAESLLTEARAEAIELTSLKESELQNLLESLLRLDGATASLLASLARGKPALAVQLLLTSIEQRLLEAGPSGFRLREGGRERLRLSTASTQATWHPRLEEVLRIDASTEAQRCLERAAVLGTRFWVAEWRAAIAPMAEPAALIDALMDRGLLSPGDDEWSFAHVALVELLIERARDSARLAEHHAACARAIVASTQGEDPDLFRVATHLFHAGKLAEALPMLHGLHRQSLSRQSIERVFEMRRAAIEALGLSAGALERGQLWHDELSQTIALLDASKVSAGDIHALAEAVEEHDWESLRFQAAYLKAQVAAAENRLMDAVEHSLEAERFARGDEDRRLLALSFRARALEQLGKLDEAEALLIQEFPLDRPEGPISGGYGYQALAQIYLKQSRYEEAGRALEWMRVWNEATGSSVVAASESLLMGDLLRRNGETERAAALYQRVESEHVSLGFSVHVIYARINRATLLLEQRRLEDAERLLTGMLSTLSASMPTVFLGTIHFCRLPCDAFVGDWTRWTEDLAQAKVLLLDHGMGHEPDAADIAELTAELAAEENPEVAREMWTLALSIWESLKQEEGVERVKRCLSDLNKSR